MSCNIDKLVLHFNEVCDCSDISVCFQKISKIVAYEEAMDLLFEYVASPPA